MQTILHDKPQLCRHRIRYSVGVMWFWEYASQLLWMPACLTRTVLVGRYTSKLCTSMVSCYHVILTIRNYCHMIQTICKVMTLLPACLVYMLTTWQKCQQTWKALFVPDEAVAPQDSDNTCANHFVPACLVYIVLTAWHEGQQTRRSPCLSACLTCMVLIAYTHVRDSTTCAWWRCRPMSIW